MSLLIILYLVGFVRTLLIIAVIYFGIKIISKYILPLLVDKGVKKMQQKMQEQQRESRRNTRPDGEVIIENNKSNSKTSNRREGDYVDFEEVE